LKVKEWKKIHGVNAIQKKAGVVLLITDIGDFRTKTVTLLGIKKNISQWQSVNSSARHEFLHLCIQKQNLITYKIETEKYIQY
jgi:hypothetical protein